jgi:hypothetical protein
MFNKEDTTSQYAFIVGNGYSLDDSLENAERSNAYALDWDGNAWFAGDVYVGADNVKLATIDSVPTKVSQLTNDKGYITDSVFHKEALNAINIDTTYNYNYIVGISESGHGTYPSGYGIWLTIVNFFNDHFVTQVAYTCSNLNDSSRDVKTFMREKYMTGSWSSWNQIYTSSVAREFQQTLFSQMNNNGGTSLDLISSYPTSAGVYRVGGNGTSIGAPASWGSLLIFNAGSYIFHMFTNGDNMWYARTDNTFTVSKWNQLANFSDVTSGSSGTPTYVLDKTTGNPIYLDFGSDGMSTTSWIAAWDGYTLRAISPSALKNVLGVSSSGSGMSREFNSGAINTTSYSWGGNSSKIYTVTTYHSESGTRHTFVFDYMAVAANGNKLRLSANTAYGNISVLMGIQGSSVGFEATSCTLTNVCGYY